MLAELTGEKTGWHFRSDKPGYSIPNIIEEKRAMKTWQKYCTGLALFASVLPLSWAQQFPGTPSPTPLPTPLPPPVAAAPGPAPTTLWRFLGLSPLNHGACKGK